MYNSQSKSYSTNSFVELQHTQQDLLYHSQLFTMKFIHSFSDLPHISEEVELNMKSNQNNFINQLENIAFGTNIYNCNWVEKINQKDSDMSNTEEIPVSQQQINSSMIRKVGCNCKKTGCLKMYCQCFSSGKICSTQCNCCNCFNHQHSLDIVQKAKLLAKQRTRRSSFDPLDNKSKKRCTCRKSQCQKKYCECFNAGQNCNENCKCEDCLNGIHSEQQHELKTNIQKKIIC